MKKVLFLAVALCALVVISFSQASAQGPRGKEFGFGLVLGEPTGLTIKYWLNKENALTASLGASYFGAPRIGVDYLWHFDVFKSNIVKMYAGPGLVLGIGEGRGFWYKEKHGKFYFRSDGETGIAFRGVFGLNIVPRNTPLEIFLELGPLVGISPTSGSAIDAALGIRFYP